MSELDSQTAAKIDAIITFWISDNPDSAEEIKAKSRMWFNAKPEDDELIRVTHGEDVERAARGEYTDFEQSARGRVALILLTDQMPRNIFRGTARAFATDPIALAQSRELVDSGDHLALHPIERTFAYMPLEHAEDRTMQALSVECFTRLAAAAPRAHQKLFDEYIEHAAEHRAIVDQFGRFPHRNKVLGRTPTAEEAAFLADSGRNFGQPS